MGNPDDNIYAEYPGHYDPNSQTWSGQCPIHYMPLPCHACSSEWTPVTYPPQVPTSPYVPQANPDPYMYHAPVAPTSYPLWGYNFLPRDCRHCFCDKTHVNSPGFVRPDHERCCNCGCQRLKGKAPRADYPVEPVACAEQSTAPVL